jgi:hypothetical protein
MSDALDQLVAEHERRDREAAALNAAPLSAITHETLDAAIAAAESAGQWDRLDRLNAMKLADAVSRTDPATGAVVPREQADEVGAVEVIVGPSVEELRQNVATIEGALAAERRNLTSVAKLQRLREEHAAAKRALRERTGEWR